MKRLRIPDQDSSLTRYYLSLYRTDCSQDRHQRLTSWSSDVSKISDLPISVNNL